MAQPANDNPRKISDDELLYRSIEQVCAIAHVAKLLSEIHSVPLTEASAKTSAESIAELHRITRQMDTGAILSRLSVNIAAAAQAKHMLGATLTVSRATMQLTLKMHYGPGPNDWHDMLLAPNVAEQLRDGITQGLVLLPPKIVMPGSKLIT